MYEGRRADVRHLGRLHCTVEGAITRRQLTGEYKDLLGLDDEGYQMKEITRH